MIPDVLCWIMEATAVTGRAVDGGLVRDFMPLIVAAIAATAMSVFEYFIQKKGKAVFS